MGKRIELTFDASSAAEIVSCFGLRIVDGKLRRPRTMDYQDVICCQCGKVIDEADDVGGFFKNDKPEPGVCCKSALCLVEAVDRQET